MKKLFHPDSPLVHAISNFGTLVWLNVLWLLCCIPVITIGASTTALYRMLFNLREYKSCKTGDFFRAFASNFKKGTLCWLLLAAMAACLVLIYTAVGLYDVRTVQLIVLGIFFFCCLLVAVAGLYMFPLTSYFENTVSNTFLNGILMAIGNPVRTVAALVVSALPVAAWILIPQFVVQLLVLWVFIVPGVLAYAVACILAPVLEAHVAPAEEAPDEAED